MWCVFNSERLTEASALAGYVVGNKGGFGGGVASSSAMLEHCSDPKQS
jgi:hypothetical protein